MGVAWTTGAPTSTLTGTAACADVPPPALMYCPTLYRRTSCTTRAGCRARSATWPSSARGGRCWRWWVCVAPRVDGDVHEGLGLLVGSDPLFVGSGGRHPQPQARVCKDYDKYYEPSPRAHTPARTPGGPHQHHHRAPRVWVARPGGAAPQGPRQRRHRPRLHARRPHAGGRGAACAFALQGSGVGFLLQTAQPHTACSWDLLATARQHTKP